MRNFYNFQFNSLKIKCSSLTFQFTVNLTLLKNNILNFKKFLQLSFGKKIIFPLILNSCRSEFSLMYLMNVSIARKFFRFFREFFHFFFIFTKTDLLLEVRSTDQFPINLPLCIFLVEESASLCQRLVSPQKFHSFRPADRLAQLVSLPPATSIKQLQIAT